MYFIITLIFISICLPINAQIWMRNGPFGAHITAIAINPSDTNFVFAGTYGKGIYRSSDACTSWQLINDGLPGWTAKTIGSPTLPSWWFGDHFPIKTILISNDNPHNMYVGLSGGGIAFSNNNGDSWQTLNSGLPDSALVTTIWENPLNPMELFCGIDAPEGGLFNSTDRGQNWSAIEEILDNDNNAVRNIIHNPRNPDSIYVAIGQRLMLSQDGGQNWIVLKDQTVFQNIIVDSLNTNRLLSSIMSGFGISLIMESLDSGITWDVFPDSDYQGFLNTIYRDKKNYLYIYKGYEKILKISKDEGHSWSEYPLVSNFGKFSGTDIFMANPKNSNSIYFGTRMGFFHSTNAGKSYVLKENGMTNTYINDVAVSPKDQSIAYAGGENGLWKTENSGAYWQRISLIDVKAIEVDKEYPDTLYVGGDNLLRSIDGGETFEVILADARVTEIEIHPVNTNIVFIGLYPSTVKKSEDFGESWVTFFTPAHGSFRIKDIEFHELNNNYVYFGTDNNQINHGLYRSTDLGKNWNKISDPGLIKSIVLQNTDLDTVFVCTDENIQVSANGGSNFTVLFNTISSSMSSIHEYPPDKNKMIAATKDNGAYILNLGNKTYEKIDGNYDLRLTSVKFHSEDNFYFTTHGDGVWLGNDIFTSINDDQRNNPLPRSFKLLSNFPNPFNSSTKIRFSVSNTEKLNIRIYNISGQIIKKFPQNKYTPGSHSIVWNGHNYRNKPVSSGLYIVSVFNNTVTRFHKIILLK